MNIDKNYRIIHQAITQANQKETILSIQPLYRELWRANSFESILTRIKLFPNPHITLVYEENNLIAFGIYHLVEMQQKLVQFRAGAVVHSNYRGKGIYSSMVTNSLNFHKHLSIVVCVRTREMQVYSTLYGLTKNIPGSAIYPDIFQKEGMNVIPKEILEIMKYFSGTLEHTHIPLVRNVYTIEKKGILQTHFGLGEMDALMVVLKARL